MARQLETDDFLLDDPEEESEEAVEWLPEESDVASYIRQHGHLPDVI